MTEENFEDIASNLPEGWSVKLMPQEELDRENNLPPSVGSPVATTFWDRKLIGLSTSEKVNDLRGDLFAHEVGHVVLGHGELEDKSEYDHMRKELQAWMVAADLRSSLPSWPIRHVVMNYKEVTSLPNSRVIKDVRKASKDLGWRSLYRNKQLWSSLGRLMSETY